MQDHELNIDQQAVCQQNIGGNRDRTGQKERKREKYKRKREMEGGESVWWWLEVDSTDIFFVPKMLLTE